MFFANESWQLFCCLVSGQRFPFSLMLNCLVCWNVSTYPNDKRVLQKSSTFSIIIGSQTRIFLELLSRDHEDGRSTWQPQGVGSEAYLNGYVAGVRHPRTPGRTPISAVAFYPTSGLIHPGQLKKAPRSIWAPYLFGAGGESRTRTGARPTGF